eukprot:12048905-Prorocentrum_lima.AAC.1
MQTTQKHYNKAKQAREKTSKLLESKKVALEKLTLYVQQLGDDLKQKEQVEQEWASKLTEKVKLVVGNPPPPEEHGFNLDDYALG